MSAIKVAKGPQGMWLTKALFFEECKPALRKEYCSFTLKDEDHEGYPSLRKLYQRYNDPTEYSFAIDVFGSWAHWKVLCNSEFFKPYIEAWREELEVKIRSDNIRKVAQFAMEDKGFQAAKWLAEGGYKDKPVGRKSKAAKEKENRINEAIESETEEDLRRLGIKLIK